MKQFIKLCSWIGTISALVVSIVTMGVLIHHDLNMDKLQKECIQYYLDKGVEPKDIKPLYGSCQVIQYKEVIILNPQKYQNYDNS